MILRRDLNANELVSAQQIRSLFSKWSKQLKDGTLSELADEELEIETNEEDISVQYQDELHELATELSERRLAGCIIRRSMVSWSCVRG